jgi:Zn-dependent peptidase ImmA (M78 family)
MLSEIPEDEVVAALDACAAEVLWEAGVFEPPIDALSVADSLGLIVARDDGMTCRGRFVRLAERNRGEVGGVGTIVVGAAQRPEREQWAVAHEIGESVVYRVFERLGVSFDESLPAARERIANRFASSLLLPRRWFAADGSELGWDLLLLKDRYYTASHELIARRMLEMRLPVVITLCDHGRVCWRRSNTCSRLPNLLTEERSVWQETHVTGLPASGVLDAESGLESVECWPIHEPDWKREILRSAVAESW